MRHEGSTSRPLASATGNQVSERSSGTGRWRVRTRERASLPLRGCGPARNRDLSGHLARRGRRGALPPQKDPQGAHRCRWTDRTRFGVKGAQRTRILFIRPDHIGDVLLTLPAVAAVRRELPGAYLAYAASAGSAAVAEHCPHLDETLTVAFPPFGSGEWDGSTWHETLRRDSRKLAGAFDAALVLRPDDPWSGALAAAASISIRLGFDMPRTRPHLTDVLPAPRNHHVSLDGFELADALLARVAGGMRTERILDPCFAPSREDEDEATHVLSEAGAAEAPVILHPGSGWPLKNWPAPRWRQVAAELARRFQTRPIVAGAASERRLAREVAEGTPAIDLAGQLSLGGLAAVHRRARLVVTTDSGALHLAAAMGARVVGLFGPGDPVLFAPLAPRDRVRVVRVGLPCSPCGTLERPPCGAVVAPRCITGIEVDGVLDAAIELLASARS
jgi:heptosyltransferase III